MNPTTAPINAGAFQFISTLVREKSAIVLDIEKSYLVESRLAPIVRQYGWASMEDLVNELRKPNSRTLTQEVVEAMTTNETSFFRDLHPFNALKSKVLPELIEKRKQDRKLVIWSNACSSGQEPYTIAMLIREHFPQLDGWDLQIIATDLSQKIIDRARVGAFNQTEVNRGLPMQMLMKYFTREGMSWTVKDHVRKMVDFRVLNLLDSWPPSPPIDIMFLRNVLIYFSVDIKTQILNRVHRAIDRNGYLFLGGSETMMNLNVRFDREKIDQAVCYRPL